MKDKKHCTIVQDLLPNYIENLTEKETNTFIEEHLKECDECKKVYELLTKEIKNENKSENKKDINYMKKYNTKIRTLKTIIIIIFTIFIILTGRKLIIIEKVKNLSNPYITSDNYYVKNNTYINSTLSKHEIFNKGHVRLVKYIYPDISGHLIHYYKDNVMNAYAQVNDQKIAILNTPIDMGNWLESNRLKSKNILEDIIMAIFTNITTEECNGKQCYRISNIPEFIDMDGPFYSILYIDKDTGLFIRTVRPAGEWATLQDGEFVKRREPDTIDDYEYKFNCVTEEQIQEPNVDEYEIHT